MTDDALRQAEIQARAQAATKGPWSVVTGSGGAYVKDVMSDATGDHVVCWGHDYDDYGSMSVEDARFCAHARQDIPWLLQRLDEAEQEKEKTIAAMMARIDDLEYEVKATGCHQCAGYLDPTTLRCLECDEADKLLEARCERAESALAAARQEMGGTLTLKALQAINTLRARRWHAGGLTEWSPLEWAAAMAGEAGEACNAAKKLKRITDQIANINLEEGRSLTDRAIACEKIGEEVADTIIYGVLLAEAVGQDIEAVVIRKFNQKSEEYGFPERINLAAARLRASPHEQEPSNG